MELRYQKIRSCDVKRKGMFYLLVSILLSTIYLGYIIGFFSSKYFNIFCDEILLHSRFVFLLVAPHTVCVAVATVCTFLAFVLEHQSFAISSGILYIVSILLLPVFLIFVIPQCIFCFIGYTKLACLEK